MLEIIQLNHILTNTSNAEKSTIIQHENVALYHDLAAQRMNKRAGKKRTTLQNTKNSEKSKDNEKEKKHDKRTMQQKNNNMNLNSDQFAVSDYHMIDIEI
jgi:arginyl-tRNA synthetase